MTNYIIQVNGDQLRAYVGATDEYTVINSEEDVTRLIAFAPENSVVLSSTVEFPEESTSEPDVVRLCRLITGAA